MKYLSAFFIFFAFLHADVSVESVYSHLHELSENSELLQSHRDSASVLSSVWNLSRNYTIEDLQNEQNEEVVQSEGTGAFTAFIKDGKVFLRTISSTNDVVHCICLSPQSFGVTSVAKSEAEKAKHISLKTTSQAFNGIVGITPLGIKNGQKDYTVKNPLELPLLAGTLVVGISANGNGNGKIVIDNKVVFSQKMVKGHVYPAPQIPVQNVTFEFDYDETPPVQEVMKGIVQVHVSFALRTEMNQRAMLATRNVSVFEQEIQLTNANPFIRIPLPDDFDSKISLEKQIVSGDAHVTIDAIIPPKQTNLKFIMLSALTAGNFDTTVQLKLTYNAFETETVVKEMRYEGKELVIDTDGKEAVSATVEVIDLSSNVKEVVMQASKNFINNTLTLKPQLIRVEGAPGYFVDCEIHVTVKK